MAKRSFERDTPTVAVVLLRTTYLDVGGGASTLRAARLQGLQRSQRFFVGEASKGYASVVQPRSLQRAGGAKKTKNEVNTDREGGVIPLRFEH